MSPGIFPADFEQKALDQTQAALAKFVDGNVPDGVEIQRIVANGTVYEEVLSKAGEIGADLIVMASHRPELQDYLLGPNAARVVRHAPISVMVVREIEPYPLISTHQSIGNTAWKGRLPQRPRRPLRDRAGSSTCRYGPGLTKDQD